MLIQFINQPKLLCFIFVFLISFCVRSQKTATKELEETAIWKIKNEVDFPRMRSEYAMAYDSKSKKIIAFGGRTGFRSDFQNVEETWAYDYSKNKWFNLKPNGSPPWRSSHAMAFDSKRNKIVLFGGNDFKQVFNDVWEYNYDQNKWSEILIPNSPAPRQMHGFIYIPDRDIFVLFGGRRKDGGPAFSDLWILDRQSNKWTEIKSINSPSKTDHVNITYDTQSKKILLFKSGETWIFNFETNEWIHLKNRHTPMVNHSSFIYNPKLNKTILFGNVDTTETMVTWLFDLNSNKWINVTPSNITMNRIEHDGMVYLNDQNVCIQYGGCCTDKTMELLFK